MNISGLDSLKSKVDKLDASVDKLAPVAIDLKLF